MEISIGGTGRNCGSKIKFPVYDEPDHDSWTVTYDNDKIYEWLLE